MADVPYKTNGKNAKFYADHLEFNDKSIRYDDITTLATSCTTTKHTYIGIPFGRSFTGYFRFTTKDGKKHTINMNAMSVFGIGKAHKNEELYPDVFEPVFTIVAKYMAQQLIDAINGGSTVELTNLSINSVEAVTKAKLAKNVIKINKENYGDWEFRPGYAVWVSDKAGTPFYNTPVMSDKNNLLVPYVLEALFGE